MQPEQPPEKLSRHADLFLEAHHHSPAAQQEVKDTMSYFFDMVAVATERAMGRLEMPDANVLRFPMERIRIPDQRDPA